MQQSADHFLQALQQKASAGLQVIIGAVRDYDSWLAQATADALTELRASPSFSSQAPQSAATASNKVKPAQAKRRKKAAPVLETVVEEGNPDAEREPAGAEPSQEEPEVEQPARRRRQPARRAKAQQQCETEAAPAETTSKRVTRARAKAKTPQVSEPSTDTADQDTEGIKSADPEAEGPDLELRVGSAATAEQPVAQTVVGQPTSASIDRHDVTKASLGATMGHRVQKGHDAARSGSFSFAAAAGNDRPSTHSRRSHSSVRSANAPETPALLAKATIPSPPAEIVQDIPNTDAEMAEGPMSEPSPEASIARRASKSGDAHATKQNLVEQPSQEQQPASAERHSISHTSEHDSPVADLAELYSPAAPQDEALPGPSTDIDQIPPDTEPSVSAHTLPIQQTESQAPGRTATPNAAVTSTSAPHNGMPAQDSLHVQLSAAAADNIDNATPNNLSQQDQMRNDSGHSPEQLLEQQWHECVSPAASPGSSADQDIHRDHDMGAADPAESPAENMDSQPANDSTAATQADEQSQDSAKANGHSVLNLVSTIRSFLPTGAAKAAEGLVPKKGTVKVKALEAADAARHKEKERAEEKIKQKNALEQQKAERARHAQEVKARQEKEQRRKAAEAKQAMQKREEEIAAARRAKEEAEKRERREKAQRQEELRQQKRQQEQQVKAHAEEERKRKAQVAIAQELEAKRARLAAAPAGAVPHATPHASAAQAQGAPPAALRTMPKPVHPAGSQVRPGTAALAPSRLQQASFATDPPPSATPAQAAKGTVPTPLPPKSLQRYTPAAQRLQEEASYEISPYRGDESDEDEEEEEERAQQQKRVPAWARGPELLRQLRAQLSVDPDDIFQQRQRTCALDGVFSAPARPLAGKRDLKERRTSTSNWIEDRVTWQEEKLYKKAMGYLK